MDLDGYNAVRANDGEVGYRTISTAMIKASGRDRLSFLQGQVSQDVLALEPGAGCRACLLNGTGHLLADLAIHAFDGHVIIETDPACGAVVLNALERYLIREKVKLEDATGHWTVVTLQGGGAAQVWERLLDTPVLVAGAPGYSNAPLPLTAGDATDRGFIVKRNRLGAAAGYDVWLPGGIVDEVIGVFADLPFVRPLDEATYETLRIEAGMAAWGAELDESVIPLEAEMRDAISFTKGCYVGQEIVARIQSRGHTNRSLRRFRLGSIAAAGDSIVAADGDKAGEAVGRLTSVAVSPTAGPVALGYVRNEYAMEGNILGVNGAQAVVLDLINR